MAFDISVGPAQLTINAGECVLITEPDGQVHQPSERGLFYRDTRLVSAWTVTVDGLPWTLLSSAVTEHFAAQAMMINPALPRDGGEVPKGTISLSLSRVYRRGRDARDPDAAQPPPGAGAPLADRPRRRRLRRHLRRQVAPPRQPGRHRDLLVGRRRLPAHRPRQRPVPTRPVTRACRRRPAPRAARRRAVLRRRDASQGAWTDRPRLPDHRRRDHRSATGLLASATAWSASRRRRWRRWRGQAMRLSTPYAPTAAAL